MPTIAQFAMNSHPFRIFSTRVLEIVRKNAPFSQFLKLL